MSVVIPDLERELFARIAPYQPELAVRLAQRLARLPDAEVGSILSSEASLLRAIEWAIAQEGNATASSRVRVSPVTVRTLSPQPQVYRCVHNPTASKAHEDQNTATTLLANRVAQLEPDMACKITEKIMNLSPMAVDECIASDVVLQHYVKAMVGDIVQEETSSKSRVPSTRVRARSPMVHSPIRPMAMVDTVPTLRSVSPLPGSPVMVDTVASLAVPTLPPTMPAVRSLSPLPTNAGSVAARTISREPMSPDVVRTLPPSIVDLRSAVMPSSPSRMERLDMGGSISSPVAVETTATAPTVRSISTHSVLPYQGLEEFLIELGMSQHFEAAKDWADRMGAFLIEELLENQDDFADSLNLRPLERSRLQRHGKDAAARLAVLRPSGQL